MDASGAEAIWLLMSQTNDLHQGAGVGVSLAIRCQFADCPLWVVDYHSTRCFSPLSRDSVKPPEEGRKV